MHIKNIKSTSGTTRCIVSFLLFLSLLLSLKTVYGQQVDYNYNYNFLHPTFDRVPYPMKGRGVFTPQIFGGSSRSFRSSIPTVVQQQVLDTIVDDQQLVPGGPTSVVYNSVGRVVAFHTLPGSYLGMEMKYALGSLWMWVLDQDGSSIYQFTQNLKLERKIPAIRNNNFAWDPHFFSPFIGENGDTLIEVLTVTSVPIDSADRAGLGGNDSSMSIPGFVWVKTEGSVVKSWVDDYQPQDSYKWNGQCAQTIADDPVIYGLDVAHPNFISSLVNYKIISNRNGCSGLYIEDSLILRFGGINASCNEAVYTNDDWGISGQHTLKILSIQGQQNSVELICSAFDDGICSYRSRGIIFKISIASKQIEIIHEYNFDQFEDQSQVYATGTGSLSLLEDNSFLINTGAGLTHYILNVPHIIEVHDDSIVASISAPIGCFGYATEDLFEAYGLFPWPEVTCDTNKMVVINAELFDTIIWSNGSVGTILTTDSAGWYYPVGKVGDWGVAYPIDKGIWFDGKECLITNIQPPKPKDVVVYPNPIGDGKEIFITTTHPQYISIFNILGEVLLEHFFLEEKNVNTIFVGDLPNGMYIMYFHDSNTIKKIIK